jgi:hypothetical protein
MTEDRYWALEGGNGGRGPGDGETKILPASTVGNNRVKELGSFQPANRERARTRPGHPSTANVQLLCKGDVARLQGNDSPELRRSQSYFSPLSTNLGQKRGRRRTCEWWTEGVHWEEMYEGLGDDFVRKRQDWVFRN